jgi:hypothetical protein
MHRQIRHSLEDYLRGEGRLDDSKLPAEFRAHLGECAECRGELRLLEEQSQWLRALGTGGSGAAQAEPRAGFYARVVGRIEERIEAQRASLWAPFLDRKFGFRLAVASAALVALLGAYLVTTEPGGPEFPTAPAVVFTDPPRTAEASAQQSEALEQQQRDAVLVNLASYRQ